MRYKAARAVHDKTVPAFLTIQRIQHFNQFFRRNIRAAHAGKFSGRIIQRDCDCHHNFTRKSIDIGVGHNNASRFFRLLVPDAFAAVIIAAHLRIDN